MAGRLFTTLHPTSRSSWMRSISQALPSSGSNGWASPSRSLLSKSPHPWETVLLAPSHRDVAGPDRPALRAQRQPNGARIDSGLLRVSWRTGRSGLQRSCVPAFFGCRPMACRTFDAVSSPGPADWARASARLISWVGTGKVTWPLPSWHKASRHPATCCI